MESIVAILPVEIKGFGIGCEIYYTSKIVRDKRSCELFLRHLCQKNAISIKLMHKKMKDILKISRNLPYFVDPVNVFFPFKINETEFDQLRRAFVNAYYVEEIKDSIIYLKNGSPLATLNKDRALRGNFNHAKELMYRAFVKESSSLEKKMKFFQALDGLIF